MRRGWPSLGRHGAVGDLPDGANGLLWARQIPGAQRWTPGFQDVRISIEPWAGRGRPGEDKDGLGFDRLQRPGRPKGPPERERESKGWRGHGPGPPSTPGGHPGHTVFVLTGPSWKKSCWARFRQIARPPFCTRTKRGHGGTILEPWGPVLDRFDVPP